MLPLLYRLQHTSRALRRSAYAGPIAPTATIMSSHSNALHADLAHWMATCAHTREDDLLRRLREETVALPMGVMQISPEQGLWMDLCVRLMNARRAIEVGVFTGYSSLTVSRALGPEGYLLACDTSTEWTSIARRYWAEAGVAERIDLRIAPASETLQGHIDQGFEPFDFAFLDADKDAQDGYYEQCLQLLRPGGLIAVDNAFLGGDVVDPKASKYPESAEVVRQLTLKVFADERVEASLVPIGDGLLLARKR